MAYMKDLAGRRLDSLAPSRDLPKLIIDVHGDDLSGNEGDPITTWPDRSGFGRYLIQQDRPAAPPHWRSRTRRSLTSRGLHHA